MEELFDLPPTADGPIYLGSNPIAVERDVMDDFPPDEEAESEAFR